MAITVVAGQSITAVGANSSGITAAHFNSTVTAGNAIIVAVASNTTTYGAASVGINDNAASSFSKIGSSYVANGMVIELWASLNCTSTGAATQTITVNPFDGIMVNAFVAQEISGLVTSSAFDKQANTSSTSVTSQTTGSVTTTTASQILLGIGAELSATRPFTAGTGYTMINTNTGSSSIGIALEYQIVAVTGSYSAGISIDLANTLGISLFTLSATTVGGGGGSVAHNLSLLGVGK